ncbi:D-alanyl-D-alanine carboxypeptidase/D-alanyl-D-alanine-endopeptidase [candidate division KSB1 bacterium]|nr:MAG: D-alanyl-D-alanine carboxypeptidase/D-alanyl-D-alanine-endopeptidase [candidate division KSB1 bacterium]
MKKYRIRLLLIIFSFSFLFMQCSMNRFVDQRQNHYQTIRKQIKFLISDPSLANAHIGIYVESLKDGQIIFENNPFKLMVPASNMKLFTTSAALVNLGPDFRFQTPVYATGAKSDSILNGDLIIRGSGDPSISGRWYNGDGLYVFKSWADSLKQMGITRINGNLIGDNRYFKEPDMAEGWNWDDEPFWYSAHTSALSFNDNCIDFSVWPDSLTKSVHFSIFPLDDSIQVINRAIVCDSASNSTLEITRINGKNIYLIKGMLPVKADTVHESITVEHPANYFLRILYKVLNQKGIRITGGIKVVSDDEALDYTSAQKLFVHQSPPLSDLIRVVNKVSHNFYADQLLKTMGAKFNRDGSFDGGCKFVKSWLESIGVAPQYFFSVDGSGLSRKNFVAPIATATLLKTLYHHPYFKYLYDSMPVAGIDGTIRHRMKGTLAEGNVHAKTGYVQRMRALSGYVNIGKNDPMIFVMMFNNYSVPTAEVNKIQDHICELLAE